MSKKFRELLCKFGYMCYRYQNVQALIVCVIVILTIVLTSMVSYPADAITKVYTDNSEEDLIIESESSSLETPSIPSASIDTTQDIEPSAEPTISIEEEEIPLDLIPHTLYLHILESTSNSRFSWVPQVSEQIVSANDIPVDISNYINPDLAYELTDVEHHIIDLIVHRESADQPFLGQVLVAEDILNRFRSGVYGPDKIAILVNGYEAKLDKSGNIHIYLGSTEILEASDSVKSAVDLALKGSNISQILLKAVTELRNEQYNLNLDETYYKWGAMYHFSVTYIADSKINSRKINRVPVSFQVADHIFYGYWLPKSMALPIS